MTPPAGRGRALIEHRRTFANPALVAAVVAMAYVGVARIAVQGALTDAPVTPVTLAPGIAVVAILSLGKPATLGAALGALGFATTSGLAIGPALLFASGSLAGILLAVWGLRRARVTSLEHLREAIALLLIVPVAMAVGATIEMLAGVLDAGAETMGPLTVFAVAWTGATRSVVVVVMAVVGFRRLPALWRRGRGARAEAVAAFLAAPLLAWALGSAGWPLLFLAPAYVTLVVLRLRLAVAGPVVLFMTAVLALAVVNGTGPLAARPPLAQALTLHAFNLSLALIVLAVATALAARDRAIERLRASERWLDERVRARTATLSRMVEALRVSEARLARAEDLAHLGSTEWDLPSNTIYLSDRLMRILAFEPGSPVGVADVVNRTHPADRDFVEDLLRSVAAGEIHTPRRFDCRIVRPDGEVRWVDIVATVHYDEAGRPERVVSTVQDITDRKRAEEGARSLDEARVRHRQALELNDEIVQALTLARYAQERGDHDTAARLLDATLGSARRMVAELLPPDESFTLVRERAAEVRPG